MTDKTYPLPSLTADVVVFLLDGEGLKTLFIRRGKAPFQGSWALPGGFAEPKESLAEAAARELTEETSLRDVRLEELATFSKPGRDPRGWVVTVAHLALVPADRIGEIAAADDASEAAWLRVTIALDGSFRLEHQGAEVTALAFDHRDIVATAVRRLRERAGELCFALLPQPFTMEDAQRALEAIFGAPMDGPRLREQLVREGLVREVSEHRYVATPVPPERRWPIVRKG